MGLEVSASLAERVTGARPFFGPVRTGSPTKGGGAIGRRLRRLHCPAPPSCRPRLAPCPFGTHRGPAVAASKKKKGNYYGTRHVCLHDPGKAVVRGRFHNHAMGRTLLLAEASQPARMDGGSLPRQRRISRILSTAFMSSLMKQTSTGLRRISARSGYPTLRGSFLAPLTDPNPKWKLIWHSLLKPVRRSPTI